MSGKQSEWREYVGIEEVNDVGLIEEYTIAGDCTKPLMISEESTTMKGGNMKTGTTTPKSRSKTKDLLLRHPNFVAKLPAVSFETSPLACEASALTT